MTVSELRCVCVCVCVCCTVGCGRVGCRVSPRVAVRAVFMLDCDIGVAVMGLRVWLLALSVRVHGCAQRSTVSVRYNYKYSSRYTYS